MASVRVSEPGVPENPDLARLRAALDAAQTEGAARFGRDCDADDWLRRRTADVDAVVLDLWRAAVGDEAPAGLFATGGYGRGELFPLSDIDLLVLAESDVQARLKPALERFLAWMWDIGLVVGHAVRSPAQCTEASTADVTVLTALMDARPLAATPAQGEALRAAIDAPAVWPAADYFAAKRDEQVQRHARYDDTAYNLEPNLRDGPGGLRDLQTLAWMGQRVRGAARLQDLVALGALGEDEFAALERERRTLCLLRIGLHLVAGRREERLLFDHQVALAKRLGYADEHREKLAVEQLMQRYFRSAATVRRINARLLQRFEEFLQPAPAAPEPTVDPDFVRLRGYLALAAPDGDLLQSDPEAVFRLFEVWQATPDVRGLHSETARALAEALDGIPSADRAGDAVRARFMALVRSGPAVVETLARMSELGVLGRYLPAFERVSGRMQYDLFHVYTVDQHTIAVLRNLAAFAAPDGDPRFASAHEVWPRLRKPELLLLAGLFHDIAKGRGGDHSELGEHDARAFCQLHGLSASDADLVGWLVRQHLVMSVTAQRQDISDPDVVARFAAIAGERERLDYLYLLTVADIAGTSPKLWNAWKDRLLADLFSATRFVLRRGLQHRAHVAERVAETQAAAQALLAAAGTTPQDVARVWAEFPEESFLRYRPEQIAWQTQGIAAAGPDGLPLVLARPHQRPGALELFVYSEDQDGLFAAVTSALDRLGLSVVEARVVTSLRGHSLDIFQVLDSGVDYVNPVRRADTVAGVVREALQRRPLRFGATRRALPRQLRHFRVPVRIEFSEAADRTQLALVCADRPGLLAEIAALLRGHHVRVHDARIATFGERAEDFFLLSDESDRPLQDSDTLQALRDALAACLQGDTPHGQAPKAG